MPGDAVPARTVPSTNCSSEMSAAAAPARRAARAAAAALDLRAARARAIAMMASPAAGSPSVRANCTATAVWCPANAGSDLGSGGGELRAWRGDGQPGYP